ncbi:hypothetical protein Y032_0007g3400 [Ancylostoma ceylanicum]|uniref:Uncharacterized protein n=1 Tax=Ancylostoma ceylanicum TaxID=53326 RepID=A0A016VNY5_9BILA|nr:hypothetical protein Y032_0007g3400 [Ancylostoma ceylanicum]
MLLYIGEGRFLAYKFLFEQCSDSCRCGGSDTGFGTCRVGCAVAVGNQSIHTKASVIDQNRYTLRGV